MAEFFTETDYRILIKKQFLLLPKKGYGASGQLAKYIGVNSTFISQVFSGKKFLNLEQAQQVCQFFKFEDLATEYFLTLVQIDRSGTENLKQFYIKTLAKIRAEAGLLKNRVKHESTISPEQQATYYSDWIYSAVRMFVHVGKQNTVELLAERMNLPKERVLEVVEFLLKAELLVQQKEYLEVGMSKSTHLDRKAAWIKSHHQNWRQKALENISLKLEEDLHFSYLVTLSKEDFDKIKEILLSTSEKINDIKIKTVPESVYCLNMDWFEL